MEIYIPEDDRFTAVHAPIGSWPSVPTYDHGHAKGRVHQDVIDANGERFAAPFDNLIQAADDPSSRWRKTHLNTQALAAQVEQDIGTSSG